MKKVSILAVILLISCFSKAQDMSSLKPLAVSYKTEHFGLIGKVKTMEVIGFSEISYSFNPHGMLTEEQSSYGSTYYKYDSNNHLSQITYSDPETEPTKVTVDSHGNVINLFDSENNQRFFEYDNKNQLIAVRYGKAKSLDFKYYYDAEGRLIKVEEYGEGGKIETTRINDYKKSENGWLVTNTSTNANSGNTMSVIQTYNSNGNLVESRFSNSKTINSFKITYDEKGNYTASYINGEAEPAEQRILIYY